MMTPNPAAFPGTPDARQPGPPARHYSPAASGGNRQNADGALLEFVATMYGMQLDQLAALLADWGVPGDSAGDRARAVVAGWRAAGYADSGELTVGEPWVWATRKGLDACGLRTRLVKPAAIGLRHTHAVTEVRLAVQRTSSYRQSRAWWRSERSILAGESFPARVGHVPDGEVHYPAGSGMPWAGDIWAVEVELSRKSVVRTATIMTEVLARTTDYVPTPNSSAVLGLPPRYARLVYVCSPVSVRSVLNARLEIGPPQSARIEVYDLPESALRLNTPKRGWEA
jgi:hypothetical protein